MLVPDDLPGRPLDRLTYQHLTIGPFSFPPSSDALTQKSLGQQINSDREVENEVETVDVVSC